ncbi:hypothetical protein Bca52824_082477 [Brassica carinata]|uniref:Uncharacterized protein n=1 Tax=Brassica carinata TaxID=52824 RepID=A0A8X7PI78_BRACI|nr:hypothetical protein Bca52824_082477 [Brassica carinata]
MAARAMSWVPFVCCLRYHKSQLLNSLRLPFFGSRRGRGIGGFGFVWSVNLAPSWWYCQRKVSISRSRVCPLTAAVLPLIAFVGPLSSVRVGFCGFLWPDFLLLVYRVSLDSSSLDAFGPSRLGPLRVLRCGCARRLGVGLVNHASPSWWRRVLSWSFACGDPGRLSGLNNARLVDAGVLVLWRDCLFLWVDA